MAYPIFYPFKTRVLNATSTSSNQTVSVPVPARAKFVTAYLATTPLASQTAAGAVDLCVNGSTAIGGVSITTSTGNSSTSLGFSTSVVYLNAGDVLSTVASSVVGYSVSFVVQEF